MTKTINLSYASLLCMAVMMMGVTTAHASEVTGTLSSDAPNTTVPDGSIGGTVTGGGGGGGGGGGTRTTGNASNNSSNAPEGSVLGASTDNTVNTVQAPGFPNAGIAPEEVGTKQTTWSALVSFVRSLFSF